MATKSIAAVFGALAFFGARIADAQNQFVLLDQTYTHNTNTRAFSFFPLPGGIPANWYTPVNYRMGKIYMRLEVRSKPSLKDVKYQICIFQDEHVSAKHACARMETLSTLGLYTWDQDMDRLFQINNIDFTRPLLDLMLVVKDGGGNPVDDRYGFGGKWDGSPNFSLYYPMEVRFTAIVVAQGATFAPPADWYTSGVTPPPTPTPTPPPGTGTPTPVATPAGPRPDHEGEEGCSLGVVGAPALPLGPSVLAWTLVLFLRRRRTR